MTQQTDHMRICWSTSTTITKSSWPRLEHAEPATVRRGARDSTSVTYAYGIWDYKLTVLYCHMVEESWWRNDTPTSSVRQMLTLSSCSTNVQHYATYLQSTLSSWMPIVMVNYIWKLMGNGYEHRHQRLSTYWQKKMKEYTVPCEINHTTGLGFRHPCDLVSPHWARLDTMSWLPVGKALYGWW